jgi:protein TonB
MSAKISSSAGGEPTKAGSIAASSAKELVKGPSGGAPPAAGAVAGPPSAGPAGPDLAALRSHIHARIQGAREYPLLARRRRQQGQVRLRFRIVGGQPMGLQVVKSAGPLLDEAAQDTVRRAAPLPAYPGELEIPVDFRLE